MGRIPVIKAFVIIVPGGMGLDSRTMPARPIGRKEQVA